MHSSIHISELFIAVVVLPFLIAGCQEDITAPERSDSPFSMFGVLNPVEPTQSLLISPVQPLLFDYPEAIDAEVSATNLATGKTIFLVDSVVTGQRGQTDHIFTANFRPEFGDVYRVEAIRSDGASSTATVRIPDEVDIVAHDESERFIDVYVSGDSLRVAGADVVYTVRWNPRSPESSTCLFEKATYAISYTDEIVQVEEGFRIRINLIKDHERVFGLHTQEHPIELGHQRADGLALMGLHVTSFVTGNDWAPLDGPLTETDFSFPGSSSNVMNGYGRVGSGYDTTRRIHPGQDVVAGSSFHDYLVRPPAECVEYCGCS